MKNQYYCFYYKLLNDIGAYYSSYLVIPDSVPAIPDSAYITAIPDTRFIWNVNKKTVISIINIDSIFSNVVNGYLFYDIVTIYNELGLRKREK